MLETVLVALVPTSVLLLYIWLSDRRERRIEKGARETIGALWGDLERARAENTTLLRQLAGIDPTPAERRQDLLEQLGVTPTAPSRPGEPQQATVGPGPLPHVPTRFEMPPEEFVDDPTDLTAPLDVIAPGLEWGMADPVPAPEPVPERDRPIILPVAVGENPFAELGIEPEWHD